MTPRTTARTIGLLDAIREASRSAHRWRDRAAAYYESSRYKLATSAKKKKEHCYSLKEKGIVAGHREGMLRYIGASPQGMGVYEYGDGGNACFHSTLHPQGVDRAVVVDHPEVILVPAKRQQQRICDVVFTLANYPEPGGGYERSAPPRIARPAIVCYECGGEGHIARYCPVRGDDDDDWVC